MSASPLNSYGINPTLLDKMLESCLPTKTHKSHAYFARKDRCIDTFFSLDEMERQGFIKMSILDIQNLARAVLEVCPRAREKGKIYLSLYNITRRYTQKLKLLSYKIKIFASEFFKRLFAFLWITKSIADEIDKRQKKHEEYLRQINLLNARAKFFKSKQKSFLIDCVNQAINEQQNRIKRVKVRLLDAIQESVGQADRDNVLRQFRLDYTGRHTADIIVRDRDKNNSFKGRSNREAIRADFDFNYNYLGLKSFMDMFQQKEFKFLQACTIQDVLNTLVYEIFSKINTEGSTDFAFTKDNIRYIFNVVDQSRKIKINIHRNNNLIIGYAVSVYIDSDLCLSHFEGNQREGNTINKFHSKMQFFINIQDPATITDFSISHLVD